MKNLFTPKNKESGDAIVGIVIIILILIAGGYYFYKMTKMQEAANKLSRERAQSEATVGVPLDANVSGATQ